MEGVKTNFKLFPVKFHAIRVHVGETQSLIDSAPTMLLIPLSLIGNLGGRWQTYIFSHLANRNAASWRTSVCLLPITLDPRFPKFALNRRPSRTFPSNLSNSRFETTIISKNFLLN